MARLPIPGEDDDQWGDLLNEFLQVAHLPNGALRTSGASALTVAAVDAPARFQATAAFVCDGVDDQVEINAALSELGSQGGKVMLSPGTFACTDAVRMPRQTWLAGSGRASILQAEASWTAFDGTDGGALVEPAGNDIDKTTVSDLTLNGNRFQGPDVRGIYYNISSDAGFSEGPDAAHVFRDVYIYRTRRHGFHTAGSRMRGCRISGVRVFNVGQEGVNEAHGFYVQHPDGFYTQCESGSATGSGFFVDGGNNRFTNCKSWYSDLSGWQVRKPRNQIASCESQDNEQHGFYITTGPTSLTSCHADSNSWNSAAPISEFDGFHIPFGNRIQLIGCSAYDKDEGGRGHWQRNGFFLGNQTEHCQVLGTVADNLSAASAGGGVTSGNNFVQING